MSGPIPVASFGGLAVLFVMATEQEYGPCLKRMMKPLMVGVGPVEAAATTAAALAQLRASEGLPDLVVSLGSAGSRILDHAAVYQVESVSYRDMDASPLGFEKGLVPFAGVPAVIPIANRIDGIPAASLSTGGDIVSGPAYDAIAADMVDMETYAVLRAAQAVGVAMIGLRGISDGRGALTGLHDWAEVLHLIDERLADCLEMLGDQMRSGEFVPAGK